MDNLCVCGKCEKKDVDWNEIKLLTELVELHEENNDRIKKEIKIFDVLLNNKMTKGEKLVEIGIILST